ncbi:MAG: hypothetical protein IH586_03180 [Anaerolineaceae bacterium]|nr:hypothetical protein [Anaerolineaceae bacterium]
MRIVRNHWLTILLWGGGTGLQFLAPLLRDRVPLSDDLLVTSVLAPWWLFLQVVLLAGWLAAFRPTANRWSLTGRKVFGVLSAALIMLLQPDLITQIIEVSPLSANPLRIALLWSTPLAFYVLPAALVVVAWLRRKQPMFLLRTLGLGLVIIGILNLPFILWLTHLWSLYRLPGG